MNRLFPLVSLVALAGCTVGPDYHAPAAPSATAYTSATPAQAALGEGPGLRWWQAFGSPQLDALVARAMAHNQSLAASDATLVQARAHVAAIAGQRLPQVDANARIEREEENLAAFGFNPSALGLGSGNPTFNLYSVGGGISYDLDLFGARRRAVEQAGAQAEAHLRQAEAAHLTIAGRVVTQVLAIAAIRTRMATVHALLDEDERTVTLTEARRKAGHGTLVEVLNARSQLASDRTVLPDLDQDLAEARDMLALLVGASPADLGPTDFGMGAFTLPAPVPVTLPSALVHKRPDILQAEADLHAATAAVGIATAHLYPDITLGASVAQGSTALGSLLAPGYRGFDLFGGISAPIFHGGTLKAEKRGAEAQARAAAASYRETVIEAFSQVADLLAALDNDARKVAIEQDATAVAQHSAQLSHGSFQVGNSGILQVIDTNRVYERARLDLVEAQARQLRDVARLYVATAGGWTAK